MKRPDNFWQIRKTNLTFYEAYEKLRYTQCDVNGDENNLLCNWLFKAFFLGGLFQMNGRNVEKLGEKLMIYENLMHRTADYPAANQSLTDASKTEFRFQPNIATCTHTDLSGWEIARRTKQQQRNHQLKLFAMAAECIRFRAD